MAKKTLTIKTKYGSFKCIFEIEKDMGGYAVEAPAVLGGASWGKNLVEAKHRITESIEGAIEARAIVNAEKKGLIQIKNNRNFIPLT